MVIVLVPLAEDEPCSEVVVARVVRRLEVSPADCVTERVDDPAFDRMAHDAEEVASAEGPHSGRKRDGQRNEEMQEIG